MSVRLYANFLVRKFSTNGQFLQIFGRTAHISTKIGHLRKIPSPGRNLVEKLGSYMVKNKIREKNVPSSSHQNSIELKS